jgi:hypothetical protein
MPVCGSKHTNTRVQNSYMQLCLLQHTAQYKDGVQTNKIKYTHILMYLKQCHVIISLPYHTLWNSKIKALSPKHKFNLLKPTSYRMHQQVEYFNNCTYCPHCIYVFCICLRTNSDLYHLHQKLVGFYNRVEKCLQRDTAWVFKWSGLRLCLLKVKEVLRCNLKWLYLGRHKHISKKWLWLQKLREWTRSNCWLNRVFVLSGQMAPHCSKLKTVQQKVRNATQSVSFPTYTQFQILFFGTPNSWLQGPTVPHGYLNSSVT